jgi:hypothetical protein
MVEEDVYRRECQMLDLKEANGRYYFRFGSGEDFAEKLSRLKELFDYRERTWNPETKEWSVPATISSERRLEKVFPNAARCFLILKSQLRLF